jgi:hypothetical protein
MASMPELGGHMRSKSLQDVRRASVSAVQACVCRQNLYHDLYHYSALTWRSDYLW